MKNSTKSALTLVILTISGICFSQSPLLKVGDSAPPITFSRWIKGDSIASLTKDRIYVIDIWAVWCGPCIAGMPHLTELQKKYKDKGVYVLGITSEDSWGNTYEEAKAFLKKREASTEYNFAWVPETNAAGKARDGKPLRGIFLHPWMKMIGSYSMPTAFIVNQEGKIAFIGDPSLVDKPVEALINKTFDMKKASFEYEETLNAQKDIDTLKIALSKGDVKKTINYGNKILSQYSFYNPKALSTVASTINTNDQISDESLNRIALDAARRAVLLTKFESSGYLDALALAYFKSGDFVNAILAEEAAIARSEGPMKENQIKNLEKYRNKLQ